MTLKNSLLLVTASILLLVAIISVAGIDRVILAGPNQQSGTSTSTPTVTNTPEDWVGVDPREYTVEYVDRAIDLYDQRGLEAMKAYYNSDASFEGEWYLFGTDENDIYVIHPLFSHLIGTDIKEVTDSTGYELGEEFARATEEGIWIEYLWPHPVTLAESPKVAYAKRHDGYMFASGYYPVPGGDAEAYTQNYVQKAIDLYDREGRDATVAHYNTSESFDNQWYLTLVSADDELVLAHGLRPGLSGTNAADLLDPLGFNVGQALLAATEDGYWFNMAFFSRLESRLTRIRVWAVRHDGHIFASGYFFGLAASPTSVSGPTPTSTPIPLDGVIDEDPFKLLLAVLSEAREDGQLSDPFSELMADLLIDSLISPNTGETREEVIHRLVVEGPLADRTALVALYNATDGPNWQKSENWLSDEPVSEWYGITTDLTGRVAEVELRSNDLAGTLPSELGSLSRLTNLNLAYNSLEGRIPSELGNMSNLKALRLYGNEFIGEMPRELADLTKLEKLWVFSNDLSGPIPVWLAELTNLEVLDLDDNKFTGEIPPELGSLTKLEDLWLARNELTGPIPPELGNLEKLELLALFDNSLTGPIPSEMGNLEQMEILFLHDNELSGEIPPGLGDLVQLKRLYLRENKLSGEIPPELGNLDKLETLHLGENKLNGEIPPELGNLDKLEYLLLYENSLTGPIPLELSSLANLEGLFLRNNDLSGEIPPELSRLDNLELLSLRNNQLTGAIPYELGDLENLRALTLGDNQLTGVIPYELGNLEDLRSLTLNENRLTGEIPRELGNLDDLRRLHLSGNRLSGCIPAGLQDVPDNDFDKLDPPLVFCGSGIQPAETGGSSSLQISQLEALSLPVKDLGR